MTLLNHIRRHLSATLPAIGFVVEGKEMAMEALNGLPDRFDHLVSALDALGSECKHFTLEFVRSRLLQEEERVMFRAFYSWNSRESTALITCPEARHPSFSHRPPCEFCARSGQLVSWSFKKHPYMPPTRWNPREWNNAVPATENAHTDDTSGAAETDTENNSDVVCLLTASNLGLNASINEDTLTDILNPWIVDFGCTSHMTIDRSVFAKNTPLKSVVHMGTNAKAHVAVMVATLSILQATNRSTGVKVVEVLHTSSFRCQIMSVTRMISLGMFINFAASKCYLQKNDRTVRAATQKGLLYYTYTAAATLPTNQTLTSVHLAILDVWHAIFVHVDAAVLRNLISRNIVTGDKLSFFSRPLSCEGYVIGKSHQFSSLREARIPQSYLNLSTRMQWTLWMWHQLVEHSIW